jgi:NADH:ubiquinone oxidoreductase subunit D
VLLASRTTCAALTPIPSMTALTLMWPSATTADMMDNYLIRFDEIRQSLRILEQALKQIPEGPINSQKPAYQVRVPAGEAYGRIESPKGELAFYVVSNGKPNPYRYHVRPASFVNLTGRRKHVQRRQRSPTSLRSLQCSTL